MTDAELDKLRKSWRLDARQLARILCLHSNKMSEYLAGVERIPCSIAMHIEALCLLSDSQRMQVFEQRLYRKTHT